jgi:hypothetical protein
MMDVIYSKWTDASINALAKAMGDLGRYENIAHRSQGLMGPLEDMIAASESLAPGEWHILVPKKILSDIESKWLNLLFLHLISPNPLEALVQKIISPSEIL